MMNRRTFLTISAGSGLAGCGRNSGQPVALPFDADATERRRLHLERLQGGTVAPNAVFTTPKPPKDLLTTYPELKGLAKVAIRLHPHYAETYKPAESRMGGMFPMPSSEHWPIDPVSKLRYLPILQLRAADAPPNCPFPPGTDLLQLLWLPQKEMKPIIVWRKEADVIGKDGVMTALPDPKIGSADYDPVPCRLYPERVLELPGIDQLPDVLKTKLPDRADYDCHLSTAPGTKIGGYPRGLAPTENTSCPVCGKFTDYLLTIDQAEWTDETKPRWQPEEERGKPALPNHAGLQLGKTFGRVHLFICRRCEGWPIRHVIQRD